jgi:hypothetical protein
MAHQLEGSFGYSPRIFRVRGRASRPRADRLGLAFTGPPCSALVGLDRWTMVRDRACSCGPTVHGPLVPKPGSMVRPVRRLTIVLLEFPFLYASVSTISSFRSPLHAFLKKLKS